MGSFTKECSALGKGLIKTVKLFLLKCFLSVINNIFVRKSFSGTERERQREKEREKKKRESKH